MKRGKLMSLADIYSCFNKYGTTESEETYVEPNPSGSAQCPSWEGNYETLRTQPTYYRLNQYMSPYISSHWESSSPVMRTMNDMSLLPPLSDKIDPNKIFNSDITALNATAADQLRTLKAFEKKFMESINDKNKFGLTEDDVAAFQAITAARNAITSITKEKIAVKKTLQISKSNNNRISQMMLVRIIMMRLDQLLHRLEHLFLIRYSNHYLQMIQYQHKLPQITYRRALIQLKH
jgi:hypothetical protein